MKKILLLSLIIFAGLGATSQTINSSSTKESLFAWLKQTFDKYEGHKAYLKETSLEIAWIGAYDIRFTKFDNINWTAFDSVTVYTKGDKNNLYTFHFNTSILEIEREVENSTKHITDYSESMHNTFHVFIPKTSGDILSDFKAVGTRLKEIAKTDPTFNANPANIVKKPIEGTPNMSETRRFIRSYFDGFKEPHKTWNYENGYLVSKGYKLLYLNFNGPILFIGYEILDENYFTKVKSKNVVNKKIDISNIQEIQVRSFGYTHAEIKNPTDVVYMTFVKKGESSPKTIDLPFATISASESPESQKETQIYKAFNHMRKLFGAPNPITFE